MLQDSRRYRKTTRNRRQRRRDGTRIEKFAVPRYSWLQFAVRSGSFPAFPSQQVIRIDIDRDLHFVGQGQSVQDLFDVG